MVKHLEQAIRIIKTTMDNNRNDAHFPYFFIVGAGISLPEIPSSNGIVEMCKKKVKEYDPEVYEQYEKEVSVISNNPMMYYSKWVEYAYPNRIDRSNLFKQLNANSRISSANLMLAQILNSKNLCNTVFTTNFDNNLERALELMGTKEFFSAENAMDNLVINNHTKDIQIIHVHGTYNFYDCANLENEISGVASQSGVISSARVLSNFLTDQAPVIVGYSGWENDVIMRCLKERLTYRTPLQYIWICHDEKSYEQLPEWLKTNECIDFIIPAADESKCGDNDKSSVLWDKGNNIKSIDATMFFRRLISEFKILPPMIFSNPYLYYSETIDALLPLHEDVLHLRHWAQRMKTLETYENEFERLVRNLESSFVIKDYSVARANLIEMNKIKLSDSDVEFVCSSLIRDFARDEDVVSSVEEKILFNMCALEFIEKHLEQLTDTENLIRTIRLLLHVEVKRSDGDKMMPLLDKAYDISKEHERLLEIRLVSLGMKTSFVDKKEKKALLEQIIVLCPESTDDKYLVYLKFITLCNLCSVVEHVEIVSNVLEAENLLCLLDDKEMKVHLLLIKSEYLYEIENDDIRRSWLQEIISNLKNRSAEVSRKTYIEIASNLTYCEENNFEELYDLREIEEVFRDLLNDYNVDSSSCYRMLEFSRCCELLCSISEDVGLIYQYCYKVYKFIEWFPHECRSFSNILYSISKQFLSLPDVKVSDYEKREWLLKVKTNPNTKSTYYACLRVVEEQKLLKDYAVFQSDIDYVKQQAKLNEAYKIYREGEREKAEQLFAELINSEFEKISNTAKTNLSFMVRRKETKEKYEFWEIVESKDDKTPTDLMNIILYCLANNATSNKQYIDAREKLSRLLNDDLESIRECWEDIQLVGEEESKIALSIINEVNSTV